MNTSSNGFGRNCCAVLIVCGCLVSPRGMAAEWSIGIYEGSSPLAVSPIPGVPNPVVSADIIGVQTDTVADPFMLRVGETWFLFFEVVNELTGQGDIGHATSSDGLSWSYRGIVLDEPYHLSYPHVFEWQGSYYMVPESNQASSIILYRATTFPTNWSFVSTLVSGRAYVDPSLFFYNNVWWMIASTTSNSNLYLFYSDSLAGPWVEHPRSPVVVGNNNIARPGGRVLQFDGRLVRFAQDDSPTYGNAVRAFQITNLSKIEYAEFELPESPILSATGSGWNSDGMHHMDAQQLSSGRWRAAVDGYGYPGAPAGPPLISQSGWSLGYVDSQELVGEDGAAVNAFDGNPSSFWHTQWVGSAPGHPHDLRINLGASYRIEGFRALARQDGGDNGRIRQFEFYVSSDGVNWGSPVASGSLADTAFEQEVQFAPVTGSYVRLRTLSAYDGDPWASLAELKVLGTLASGSPSVIPQTSWSLRYVDSQELVGEDGAAVNAFDGNPSSFWHTKWYGSSPPHPHEIQINLGAAYRIEGFRVLARQDGGDNGRIRQFEFYVSSDGVNWGSPVASGSLADTAFEQEVQFAPVTGSYVRLRTLSAYDGDPWATLAEIRVLGGS